MRQSETFAGIMATVPPPHDPLTVFGDFLAFMAFSLAHLDDPGPQFLYGLLGSNPPQTLPLFPKLIGAYRKELVWRRKRGLNPDVLGEYYMVNSGVRLRPWDECRELAAAIEFPEGTMAVDHSCESGRLLLAMAERFGYGRRYCGVETGPLLANMAAITLFCNGVWDGEVVCPDPHRGPAVFGGGWRFSAEPEGLFPILRAEDSGIWKLHMEEIRVPKAGNPQLRFW